MKYFFTIFFLNIISVINLFAQTQPGSGNTLLFNGSSYINCSANNRGITNKVTVEAWIKTTNTNLQMICTKYNNPADHGFQLFTQNGYASFNGRDGSALYKTSGFSTTTVTDGKWHHVVGTYNLSLWEIWVDGIKENGIQYSSNSPDLINTAPFSIGNYQLVNNNFFVGEIDEVRLWNTVRTSQEIRDNMCRKLNVSSPGLVGYYKLDEGTGTTTADQSSFNISGTLTNMPATAWRTSGAAIGDISTYLYTNNWLAAKVKIPGVNNDSLTVKNVSNQMNGIQLYRVNGLPVSTAGISNPGNITGSYFGVFPVKPNNGIYQVEYKTAKTQCNNDSLFLYQRTDNSISGWAKVSANFDPANFTLTKTATTATVRAEFIIQKSFAQINPIKITGNLFLCSGNGTTLNVTNAQNGSTFLWNTGQTTPSINISLPGQYYVTVSKPNSCTQTDTVFVNSITATAGEDITICSNENAVIGKAPTSGYIYLWSPATGLSDPKVSNPTVNLSNNTNNPIIQRYLLTTTFNGCTTTDQVEVTVKPANKACNKNDLIIYNIITANNDRLNDFFTVENIHLYPGNELTLFNRWGVEIFRQKDYLNDWSGKNCADGTYYYLLKLKDGRSFKGWFEIVRD